MPGVDPPLEFGGGESIERQVGNPLIVSIDGTASTLLSPTAIETLVKALQHITREVVWRAHKIAVEFNLNNYPYTPIESVHVERAVSQTILALAKVIPEKEAAK